MLPTEAATAIVGKLTNGWGFFPVDKDSRRSLRQVLTEYYHSVVGSWTRMTPMARRHLKTDDPRASMSTHRGQKEQPCSNFEPFPR